ncbi:hypothetical protein ACOMHN_048785 [Nucella lapillus]
MVPPNATKNWRRATPNTPEPEKRTHHLGNPNRDPTAPLHQPSTVLLQSYSYNPTPQPSTVPLHQLSTVLLQSYYSPTPTTLLHNPLQSHCTNRDPLQQHPYHESPNGRGCTCSISHTLFMPKAGPYSTRLDISPHHLNDSYSKTPMRTSHPISPRVLLQATPASGHQPHP